MVVDNNSIHRSSFPSVVKQWLLLMSSTTSSPTHSLSEEDHRHHSDSRFESTYFSFPDYDSSQQPELETKSAPKQCRKQDPPILYS
ncbi:hypothetical protein [Absidia glauca]|uniref:Uncharacterized protein n=1 Tax=Absidia glauca TaxID=4829 RepID=A0A163K294_ABSGL|nr:hypothetical protein [Absidia glauca]